MPIDATQRETWDQIAQKVNFTLVPDMGHFQHFVPDLTARLLDFGCGYGRNAHALVDLGYPNVVGYDTSSQLIARGRATYPDLDLNTYEPPHLPEAKASFDAIICCAVLTCLPNAKDRADAMTEMLRVLKPGGVLYLAEFLRTIDKSYDTEGCFTATNGIHMKHFMMGEIEGTLPPSVSPLLCHKTKVPSLSGTGLSVQHLFIQRNDSITKSRLRTMHTFLKQN